MGRMNNVSIAFFDLFRKFSMTDKIVVLSTCASEEEAEGRLPPLREGEHARVLVGADHPGRVREGGAEADEDEHDHRGAERDTGGDLSDPVVQAHVTVTFHRPKTGLLTKRGSAVAGRVLVAPIGIPQEADRV